MQKIIQQQTIFVIFLFLLEICAAGTLFFLMDHEFLDVYIKDILIGTIFIIIMINFVAILIMLNTISNNKMKTDVNSLNVIGNDIQEAYDFGKIGLIVTDDNNEVIWTNKLFERLQFKLMDHNIFDWVSDLKDFQNDKISELQVEIDSRYYLVKYLKEAHLYIFKDITEVEDLIQASINQAPVIGLISIDNYQDMTNILDETSLHEGLTLIQRSLSDYARTFNLLLKKFKSDTYLFVCEHSSYEKMAQDRFSILKEVSNSSESDSPLTLSIGIALGIKDYSRLYEFASSSLDVALSRGGNQCVVSNYGENLKFYGGQTEAKGSKNTVKSRVNANSLYTHMQEATNVYVMGHSMMDLDALGACLGIYAIGQYLKVKTKIIYDDSSVERQTKNAFKRMYKNEQLSDMIITPSKAVAEYSSNSLLVVVDVNNPDMVIAPTILNKAEKIIVIDHHRPGKKHFNSAIMSFIDASASSTCELIAEMVRYGTKNVTIPPIISTFMLAGIILDTNYYRKHMGAKTYDASYNLKLFGADNAIADSFFKEQYEEHLLRTKIKANSYTPHTGVVVCCGEPKEYVDRATLAKVGDEISGISGVNLVFVIGEISEKEVYISSRSDGSISCQLLCEKLGGGGHYTASAVTLMNCSIEEAKNRLAEVLNLYLYDSRSRKGE